MKNSCYYCKSSLDFILYLKKTSLTITLSHINVTCLVLKLTKKTHSEISSIILKYKVI